MKNAMHIFYSFLLGVIFCGEPSFSQKFTTVTGRLYDQVADQPLPYANIILLRQADKSLAEGTSSDTGGYFRLDHIEAGSYLLQVSMMGYTTISREVLLKEDVPFEAGVLLMQEQTTELKEVNIAGFRSKGKTDQDKTVFYMTGKIYEASQSGADALRYIPGIRMDLLQNISLDGSRNILLLIDGRESEMSFVRQIDAHDIDRVEIMSTPPARYDAEVTGVINIILKKDKKPGLFGHILLDIPTAPQVMYARPSANLNFSFRNIHIYGSYSGEMICGDLYDHTTRTIAVKTKYDLYVRQKYVSHQCDLGLDYFVTKKDQLRFRAYYNPGSASYSGSAVALSEGEFAINSTSGYERSDRNRQTYYSVFYQHRFNEKGSELTLDIINTNLRSEQITDFTAVEIPGGSGTFQNKLEPGQNSLSVRIDGRLPLNKKLELGIGSRMKWQHMFDATNEFDYSDLVCAVYTTMGFTHEKYDWTIGIPVEDARSEFKDDFENHVLSVLPNVSLNFKLPAKQNIRFAAGNLSSGPISSS